VHPSYLILLMPSIPCITFQLQVSLTQAMKDSSPIISSDRTFLLTETAALNLKLAYRVINITQSFHITINGLLNRQLKLIEAHYFFNHLFLTAD